MDTESAALDEQHDEEDFIDVKLNEIFKLVWQATRKWYRNMLNIVEDNFVKEHGEQDWVQHWFESRNELINMLEQPLVSVDRMMRIVC
jgi:hypothetical protein